MRKSISILLLCAAGALAVPAQAQDDLRDFTLPEPTPSATPQAQGPVDDAGVVPVAPRVIPTDTPTPGPTPTAPPTPRATNTPAPVRTQAATPAGTRAPSGAPARITTQPQQRPPASPAPSPLPTSTLSPLPPASETTVPQPSPTGAATPAIPILPEATPDAAIDPVETSDSGSGIPWLYILGGLLALITAIGGFLFWKRRQENAPPPKIKRPVVDAALDYVAATAIPPRFDLTFEVEGISRSLMAVMVSGRIVIENRGERAIRNVALKAELTSAHHPDAKGEGQLEDMTVLERIGPHQTQRHKINLKLPLDQVAGMRKEGVPFFVPLLRLEAATDGVEAKKLDLVLGTVPPGVGQKLQPLRLDGPPGAYENLRGHPLTA